MYIALVHVDSHNVKNCCRNQLHQLRPVLNNCTYHMCRIINEYPPYQQWAGLPTIHMNTDLKWHHLNWCTKEHVVCLFLFERFINARRRIVQPMIDQSNRAGKDMFYHVFWNALHFPSTQCMHTVYHIYNLAVIFSKSRNRIQPWWSTYGWLRVRQPTTHGSSAWWYVMP